MVPEPDTCNMQPNGDARLECVPCRQAERPLSREEVKNLLQTLSGAWAISDGADRLRLRVSTGNFSEALALVNRIAAVAEKLDHHPDLAFGWGWVEIVLWTHKVNGLTAADFVLARDVEQCCGMGGVQD